MRSIRFIYVTISILLATLCYSQNKQEIVIVKIQQNYDQLKVDSYILISYPNETTKTIGLVSAGFRENDKEEISNALAIQMTVNSLIKEGYEIVSTDICGDIHFTRTLMVFSRKKE